MIPLLKWLFKSSDPKNVEITVSDTGLVGDRAGAVFDRGRVNAQDHPRDTLALLKAHLEANYIPFTGYDFPSQIAPPDVPLCPSRVRPAETGYTWGPVLLPVYYTAVTPLNQDPYLGVTSGHPNGHPMGADGLFLFYNMIPFGIPYWRTGKPLVQFALHPIADNHVDYHSHRLIVCNYKRLLPTRQTQRYYNPQIGCAFHFVICPRLQRRYLVGIRASAQNEQWYSKPQASDIVWVKIIHSQGLPRHLRTRLIRWRPIPSLHDTQPFNHRCYTGDYTLVKQMSRADIDDPFFQEYYLLLRQRLCPHRQTPSARHLQLCQQLNPYESSPFRDPNRRAETATPAVAPGLTEEERTRFNGIEGLISANTPELYEPIIALRQLQDRLMVPHVAPGLREDV